MGLPHTILKPFETSESNRPLISVITIFLNAERFLQEAIHSVLGQTYRPWELLLVDDGSTDRSSEIARRYAAAYPGRIHYLDHPGHSNRGMSASRNAGAARARGDLLAFLDADDIWLPEKLEYQAGLLETHKAAAMICGPTLRWFSWTGQPVDAERDAMRFLGVSPKSLVQPPLLLPRLLRDQAKTPATCSVLIRRTAFDQVGGFEESFRGMYEDQAFFAKTYLSLPIFFSDECHDLYRQHPESCCAISEMNGLYDPHRENPSHHRFLEWLREYAATCQVRDPEFWAALDQALWPYRHPIRYQLRKTLRRPARSLEQLAARTLRPIMHERVYSFLRMSWRGLRRSGWSFTKSRRESRSRGSTGIRSPLR